MAEAKAQDPSRSRAVVVPPCAMAAPGGKKAHSCHGATMRAVLSQDAALTLRLPPGQPQPDLRPASITNTAACIAIQLSLGRPLLWSGFWHHIGEVLLSHIFTNLKVETSRSPEVALFARLRHNWNLVTHDDSGPMSRYIPGDAEPPFLRKLRAELTACAAGVLDYKRVRAAVSCVSGCTLGAAQTPVTFQRLGVLHKERWMAKLLYTLKLALTEQHIAFLPQGTITTRQQSVGTGFAASAIKALERYLWYLTGEMPPLDLFSTKVPVGERRTLADAILEHSCDLALALASESFQPYRRPPAWPTSPTQTAGSACTSCTSIQRFSHST
ncbi:hypothetical protein AAFF_G00033660 [Aldrovandia affinis]|uniref:Uncharacterized protein n=1 Tax=Aldrovandia affinis TaxID=143900 RepID=A0AAD7WFN3_9TELE|nr:hypothetical protein AAFF_G00033660 [Aldrovandia affinis]